MTNNTNNTITTDNQLIAINNIDDDNMSTASSTQTHSGTNQ